MRDVLAAEADRAAGRRRAAASARGQRRSCRSPTRRRCPSVSPSCRVNETSSTACTLADRARRPARPARTGKCTSRCSTSSSGVRRPASARRHALTPSPSAQADRARRPSRRARFSLERRASSGRGARARRDARSSGGTSVHWSNACGQRGRKWQPCGGSSSDGGEPGIAGSRARAVAVEPGDRAQQPPRVRVLRVVEDLVERALLDDPPGVHHEHAVGDVGDDAEVVGDQDDRRRRSRRAAARSSRRICAWIVTSSAVVGSSAISSSGEQDSAIAIITRWRMPPENSCGYERAPLARARDADALQQLDGAVAAPRPCEIRLVRADLLDDLVADPVDRVQRRSSGPGRPSRSPRRGCPRSSSLGRRRAARCRRSCAEPSKRALGERVSPISVIAVTDLPEPDSPTIARTSPGSTVNDTPSTACTTPSSVREGDVQVVDVEQRARVASCQPDPRVEERRRRRRRPRRAATTKNAPSIVITRIGGTSRRPIESAAYWPTPCRLKTDLGEDRAAADHRGEVQAAQRDDRDQRVAQHVADHHPRAR